MPSGDAQDDDPALVNLAEPELAERVAKRNVDGVGLLRAEFIVAQIGTHPRTFIEEGRRAEYTKALAEGIASSARRSRRGPWSTG